MKRRLLIFSAVCLGLITAGWLAWPQLLNVARESGASRNRETNRLPADALRALFSAPNLTLFSIDPKRSTGLPAEVLKFRGYNVLGQTTALGPESRRQLASTLERALEQWSGNEVTMCWSPRHAIRATDELQTYEFLICFECGKLRYFPPSGESRSLEIRTKPGPFNEILIAAKIPVQKQTVKE